MKQETETAWVIEMESRPMPYEDTRFVKAIAFGDRTYALAIADAIESGYPGSITYVGDGPVSVYRKMNL